MRRGATEVLHDDQCACCTARGEVQSSSRKPKAHESFGDRPPARLRLGHETNEAECPRADSKLEASEEVRSCVTKPGSTLRLPTAERSSKLRNNRPGRLPPDSARLPDYHSIAIEHHVHSNSGRETLRPPKMMMSLSLRCHLARLTETDAVVLLPRQQQGRGHFGCFKPPKHHNGRKH
jgi:hypothetical protein